MSGTTEGGLAAMKTNKHLYGEDFYARIGSKGGSTPNKTPKGFASSHELAVRAGRIGGSISKRRSRVEA